MDRFSDQLANLQRAASRAGRDDGNNNSNNNNGSSRGSTPNRRDNNNNSSTYQQNRSRDGGYGGRRDDRYYNQSRKRGRDGDIMRDGRSYSYDDRGRFHNNSSYHDRDHYRGNNNRYGDSRGRDGGGGRWRNDNGNGRNNNNQEQYNYSAEQATTTLAELVNNVKSSYQASKRNASSTSTNDAKIAKGNKRRHIALLFLTIDDLPHEHIWKEWLNHPSSSSSTDIAASEENKKSSSSGVETPLVSVLCHAKYPNRIKSEWLQQRHLQRKNDDNRRQHDNNNDESMMPRFHSHRPEWGSVEITRAMIDLLEEALRIGTDESTNYSATKYLSTPADYAQQNSNDSTEESKSANHCQEQDIPPVDRFIFVSETCLPVTTLEEVELALFGPRNTSDSSAALYNKSWINARSTPNNGYSRQLQWDAIRTDNIPHSFIWKADQWMVLTRSHADAVASLPSKHLNGRQLWPAFRKCRASDEIYFPTVLSILGIISRQGGEAQEVDDSSKGESCAGSEIRRRRVTYCDWSQSAKNPASFTSQDWKDVVMKARGAGCLFARKFVLLSSLRVGANKNVQPINSDGVVSVDDWITVVKQKHFGETQRK